MTIGPHEGRELELMLSGQKHLAAFGDIIPDKGDIPENIIPEKAFAPYVQSGQILRLENTVKRKSDFQKMRHVCFVLPEYEWKAHTYLWLRAQIHSGEITYETSHDIIFGKLLSYSQNDISEFIRC